MVVGKDTYGIPVKNPACRHACRAPSCYHALSGSILSPCPVWPHLVAPPHLARLVATRVRVPLHLNPCRRSALLYRERVHREARRFRRHPVVVFERRPDEHRQLRKVLFDDAQWYVLVLPRRACCVKSMSRRKTGVGIRGSPGDARRRRVLHHRGRHLRRERCALLLLHSVETFAKAGSLEGVCRGVGEVDRRKTLTKESADVRKLIEHLVRKI